MKSHFCLSPDQGCQALWAGREISPFLVSHTVLNPACISHGTTGHWACGLADLSPTHQEILLGKFYFFFEDRHTYLLCLQLPPGPPMLTWNLLWGWDLGHIWCAQRNSCLCTQKLFLVMLRGLYECRDSTRVGLCKASTLPPVFTLWPLWLEQLQSEIEAAIAHRARTTEKGFIWPLNQEDVQTCKVFSISKTEKC